MTKMGSAELARIRETFAYDPETGIVTRLRAWGRPTPGRPVGADNGRGYLVASFASKMILCTHIAWVLMLGRRPTAEVDHINGDSADNRWCNLREVTHSVNMQNQRRACKNNKSGFLGVSPCRDRWRSRIKIDGKTHCLGSFDTPRKAYEAYLTAKRIIHNDGCSI